MSDGAHMNTMDNFSGSVQNGDTNFDSQSRGDPFSVNSDPFLTNGEFESNVYIAPHGDNKPATTEPATENLLNFSTATDQGEDQTFTRQHHSEEKGSLSSQFELSSNSVFLPGSIQSDVDLMTGSYHQDVSLFDPFASDVIGGGSGGNVPPVRAGADIADKTPLLVDLPKKEQSGELVQQQSSDTVATGVTAVATRATPTTPTTTKNTTTTKTIKKTTATKLPASATPSQESQGKSVATKTKEKEGEGKAKPQQEKSSKLPRSDNAPAFVAISSPRKAKEATAPATENAKEKKGREHGTVKVEKGAQNGEVASPKMARTPRSTKTTSNATDASGGDGENVKSTNKSSATSQEIKTSTKSPRSSAATTKKSESGTPNEKASALPTPKSPATARVTTSVDETLRSSSPAAVAAAKDTQSKVGSMANVKHTPRGGNVKIYSEKIDLTNVQSRCGSKDNVKHTPRGGDKKIESHKLEWKVKSKIGSLDNATHKPAGGERKVETKKLEWNVTSKVGSLDNAKHKAGGGARKIENRKLEWNAAPKVGSLDNAQHHPGGGDKKIESKKLDFKEKAKARTEHQLRKSSADEGAEPMEAVAAPLDAPLV